MDTKYLQGLRDIADMARDAERYRKLRDCHWDLGGIVIPGQKVVDNTIIPRDQLEATLNEVLPQLG